MDWYWWMALGALLCAASFWVLFLRLVPDEEDRRTILQTVFPSTAPPPPPPDEPSPPPPEPEPKRLLGNVKARADEWDRPADTSKAYDFPDLQAPVTRYEDFNRRLFVFTESKDALHQKRLPLRSLDDFPMPIRCSRAELEAAIDAELRSVYPVIIDWNGRFAKSSANLELDPSFEDIVVNRYLAIPEKKRPVVISYAGGYKPKEDFWTFRRYQFEHYDLPLRHIQTYPEDHLEYVLGKFLGSEDDWMWFSIARMRDHISRQNQPIVEARLELQKQLHTNRFVKLWYPSAEEDPAEDEDPINQILAAEDSGGMQAHAPPTAATSDERQASGN